MSVRTWREPRRGRPHTSRPAFTRLAVGLIAPLLVIGSVVAGPTPPAEAMAQVGSASGLPGDTVQVQVQNTTTGPGNTFWTITAPPDTTVTAASGAAANGSGPFGCSLTASGATCGPSSAGGWASGNIVTMTLAIAPAATARTVTGFSFIPGDEGSFQVTILPPTAPALTAPANGSRTLETRPAITGTKRAGNAATVSVDGAPGCDIAADASTSWTCTPPILSPGIHSASATQTSPAGDVSPASTTTSFEVLEPAALSLAPSGPATAVPTVPLARTVTVTNTGPGTAVSTEAIVDLGGFPATACTVDGAAQDCADLASGVPLGDLALGRQVPVVVNGVVPLGTAPGTAYTITASLISPSDAASPVADAATVTVGPPAPPRITTPANGSQTTDSVPVISGDGAVPGALVTVTGPAGAVCTATATPAASWSCAPSAPFALGGVGLNATQTIGGLTSANTASSFTVIAVPVAPPAPTPSRPAPRPTTVRTPTPAITSTPTPAPAPAKPAPSRPAPAPAAIAPLQMSFTFAASRIDPGTVGVMRGTLGPNATASPTEIILTGRVDSGMVYRSVALKDGGVCTVLTTTFSCTITLAPGESAQLELRLYADALNAPANARQQLVATSTLAAQSNAMTSTIDVGGSNESAALAASFSTFPITTFPGAFGPLLALLLLALAATETEKRRRAKATATPAPSPVSPASPPAPTAPTPRSEP